MTMRVDERKRAVPCAVLTSFFVFYYLYPHLVYYMDFNYILSPMCGGWAHLLTTQKKNHELTAYLPTLTHLTHSLLLTTPSSIDMTTVVPLAGKYYESMTRDGRDQRLTESAERPGRWPVESGYWDAVKGRADKLRNLSLGLSGGYASPWSTGRGRGTRVQGEGRERGGEIRGLGGGERHAQPGLV